MIVTIVKFPGTETASVEEATAMFAGSAASYITVPGLMGKIYLRAQDGSLGAVYWWSERSDAEAKFNAGWRAGVAEKYSAEPIVEFYDAPVVVDAIFGAIRTEVPQKVFGGQGSL